MKMTEDIISRTTTAQSVKRLGYGLDDCSSRVRFPAEMGIFLSNTASRTDLEPTEPPIQEVTGVLSLVVKRSGREADHAPPSRAEVKKRMELYIHSPIHIHDVVLS
jgi:hypothetical protein